MFVPPMPKIIEFPVFEKGFIPPDSIIMEKLNLLIEQNYKNNKPVSFYTGKMNLSLKVLNAIIKRHRNKSLYGLIQQRIYMQAAHLILNTHMTVKEISYSLGVSDPSYFSRRFKIMTGMNPRNFKMINNNNYHIFKYPIK